MYSDTTEHDGFDGFVIQRSAPDDAVPLSRVTKVLICAALAAASWAVVILVAYSVWSLI